MSGEARIPLFNIRPDIQEIINVGVLRKFAKTNGIEHAGTKHNLINNIVVAVRAGTVSEEIVRSFIQEQLWYGKNKHTFFIEVVGDTISNFSDTAYLIEYFSDRGIQRFNNIDRVNLPDGVPLVRFDYETNLTDSSVVNKVMLGYVEKAYTYRIEGGAPIFKSLNMYICVEIDLVNNLLVLRLRSRSGLKASQVLDAPNVTAIYLAKKHLEHLQQYFGFEYLDGASEEMKNTMFNIEKALTTFIELQFKPKVSQHEQLIEDFTSEIAEKIGLTSNIAPINLNERIIGLLERSLIVQNEEVIKSYVEGKLGYVNMFDFKDDRGGRINARSKHSSTPIQTSDIFFDTRETINEVKLLDTLSMVWFKLMEIDGDDDNQYLLEVATDTDTDTDTDDDDDDVVVIETQNGKKVIQIKIKIAAYKAFYKIEFKRYILKEEYDHVLSLIERFRGV